MELEYIIALIALCVCFITTLIGLKTVAANLSSFVPDYNWRKDTFLPIYLTVFVAFAALSTANSINYDIIFPLRWYELLLVFAGAGTVYVISILPKTTRFTIFALLAAAVLCGLFLPRNFLLFQNHLPFWIDRPLMILLWVGYAWCFRYLNGIDGMVGLQASTISGGLVALSLLGGLPILFGSFSMALLGSFLALLLYSWYPAKLLLKDGACITIGFLLGWMIILSAREGTAACALIYSMYFIIEILWAIARKILANGSITSNTVYYSANTSGLSPAVVCQNISRIQTILLVIGSFQIYAPNNYSLPLLSAFITLWFMSRLRNWQHPRLTLKEINRGVIEDIKDNVEDIKKIVK